MPRAGLTRDKIIVAAGKMADEQGFEVVTLAAMARQFQVRLPSLYAHLASSNDLKKGIALLALRRLAQTVEDAVAGRSRKDALIAFVEAHRGFAREHPGLFQAARYPLDPEGARGSGGARIAKVSLAMFRGYHLDDEDGVHATRLIGSFVLGFSLLELSGSFGHSSPDIEISLERGIDGLDALISTWTRP